MAARARDKDSYHHGDLKNSLIATAARLIDRRKDVSFTIRELAAEANVSHAAAYRHFASKRDILAAVAEVGFGKLQADLAAVKKRHASHPDRELVAQAKAYVEFAISHPGNYRAMFHPELGGHDDYAELSAVAKQAFDSLLETVTRGVEKGLFAKRPPLELAIAAWSTVHGLSLLMIDGQLFHEKDLDAGAREHLPKGVAELLVGGLLKRLA